MARNTVACIDIGSSTTRIAIAQFEKGEKFPKIIGTGSADALGMREGYIIHPHKALESVKRALGDAVRVAGVSPRHAILAANGVGLLSSIAVGSAIMSKADGEVTSLDVEKSLRDAEHSLKLTNRKILHTIPLSFSIDSKPVIGRPEGMQGIKLDTKALFISILAQHVDDFVSVASSVGLDVVDVIAGPLAGSIISTNEKQRTAGCAVINIGSDTVSVSVFEDDFVTLLFVIPIGSNDITNDIALGLKVSLEEAESIKIGNIFQEHSQKKIQEIISARLIDIFEHIDAQLRKIKRSGLLPAGVILTGGGARIAHIAEIARDVLGLPARIGEFELKGNKFIPKDAVWLTAAGLPVYSTLLGAQTERHYDVDEGTFKDTIKNFFKQLLP